MNANAIWLLSGVAILSFFVIQWIRHRILRSNARGWPTAVGKIESTDLRQERRGDTQSVHVAEISYSYEAMGEVYSGTWLRNTIFHGKAEKWIKDNVPDTEILVRYNPDDAKASTILESDQSLSRD